MFGLDQTDTADPFNRKKRPAAEGGLDAPAIADQAAALKQLQRPITATSANGPMAQVPVPQIGAPSASPVLKAPEPATPAPEALSVAKMALGTSETPARTNAPPMVNVAPAPIAPPMAPPALLGGGPGPSVTNPGGNLLVSNPQKFSMPGASPPPSIFTPNAPGSGGMVQPPSLGTPAAPTPQVGAPAPISTLSGDWTPPTSAAGSAPLIKTTAGGTMTPQGDAANSFRGYESSEGGSFGSTTAQTAGVTSWEQLAGQVHASPQDAARMQKEAAAVGVTDPRVGYALSSLSSITGKTPQEMFPGGAQGQTPESIKATERQMGLIANTDRDAIKEGLTSSNPMVKEAAQAKAAFYPDLVPQTAAQNDAKIKQIADTGGIYDPSSGKSSRYGDPGFAEALARNDPSRYDRFAALGAPGFTVGGAAKSTGNRENAWQAAKIDEASTPTAPINPQAGNWTAKDPAEQARLLASKATAADVGQAPKPQVGAPVAPTVTPPMVNNAPVPPPPAPTGDPPPQAPPPVAPPPQVAPPVPPPLAVNPPPIASPTPTPTPTTGPLSVPPGGSGGSGASVGGGGAPPASPSTPAPAVGAPVDVTNLDPVQQAMRAETMRNLQNPSPYDDKLWQAQVDKAKASSDEQWGAAKNNLDADLAARGINFSSIAGNKLSDFNTAKSRSWDDVMTGFLSDRANGIAGARAQATNAGNTERTYYDNLRQQATGNEFDAAKLQEALRVGQESTKQQGISNQFDVTKLQEMLRQGQEGTKQQGISNQFDATKLAEALRQGQEGTALDWTRMGLGALGSSTSGAADLGAGAAASADNALPADYLAKYLAQFFGKPLKPQVGAPADTVYN